MIVATNVKGKCFSCMFGDQNGTYSRFENVDFRRRDLHFCLKTKLLEILALKKSVSEKIFFGFFEQLIT